MSIGYDHISLRITKYVTTFENESHNIAFLRHPFFVKNRGKLGHGFLPRKRAVSAKCPVVRGEEKQIPPGNYRTMFF